MNEFKTFSGFTLALAVLSPAFGACSAEMAGEEAVGEARQAVEQTAFQYLRCNATGFGIGEANRLKPTSDPNVFALDYTVALPYLATSPDSCLLTQTNQLNGFGTSQTNFQTNAGVLNVPGQRNLQVGWQNIQVRYPTLGGYRATFNVAQRRISIAAQQVTPWRWPLAGLNGKDWVINNYVYGNAPGPDDYTGGTRTYDFHRGIDIDISTFRNQDAGTPVLSVGAGQVIALQENQFDRNTFCAGDWNHVTVRTPDGWTLMYGHLKRDSVVVNVGDNVQAGQTLGMVGSSGCSTQPHLHLETTDAQGNLVDPFQRGLWQSPPVYDVPIQIMDSIINAGFFGPDDSLLDPRPNITELRPPYQLTGGLSVGGGNAGDAPGFRIVRPNGTEFDRVDFTFDSGPLGHTLWLWGWDLGPTPPLGTWQVQVLRNGTVERTHAILLRP